MTQWLRLLLWTQLWFWLWLTLLDLWLMTHDSWLVTCYPWLQDLFWFISLMTTMTLWWLINLWLMTHDSWLMTRDSWLTYDSRLKTQDLWLLMKLTLRRFIIDCELWFLMTHDSWLSWLDFYFRLIWPYELMKTNNPLWDSILLIMIWFWWCKMKWWTWLTHMAHMTHERLRLDLTLPDLSMLMYWFWCI